jgi:hypothetical protein
VSDDQVQAAQVAAMNSETAGQGIVPIVVGGLQLSQRRPDGVGDLPAPATLVGRITCLTV